VYQALVRKYMVLGVEFQLYVQDSTLQHFVNIQKQIPRKSKVKNAHT